MRAHLSSHLISGNESRIIRGQSGLFMLLTVILDQYTKY